MNRFNFGMLGCMRHSKRSRNDWQQLQLSPSDPAPVKTRLDAVLFFDGGCEPNPGEGTAGFVLKIANGKVVERSTDLGHGTNNTAEYNALILGLEEAVAQDVTHIEVYGDSMIVIGGVKKGPWKKGKPHLEALKARAIELLRSFSFVDLNWVGREENEEAHNLTVKA